MLAKVLKQEYIYRSQLERKLQVEANKKLQDTREERLHNIIEKKLEIEKTQEVVSNSAWEAFRNLVFVHKDSPSKMVAAVEDYLQIMKKNTVFFQ